MTMRWLKKREVVVYYLLYRKFRFDKFNVGEALDTLKPYFSKKVSLSVIKYLSKKGLVNSLGNSEYSLVPFEEFLYLTSYEYIKRRSTLRRRTRG
ncbi:MAG: hypothetical protein K1T65_01515 [Candidatus Aramenus sp.]|nr:hypothetical protein [Candidatus Aramenus sp.]